jgi:transposase-like protein
MSNPTPDLQARRAIEDELVQLGSERTRLESELATNVEAIVAAIPQAIKAGVPFDGIAHLVGISRQTLYRWQGVIQRLRNEQEP